MNAAQWRNHRLLGIRARVDAIEREEREREFQADLAKRTRWTTELLSDAHSGCAQLICRAHVERP